MIAAFLKNADGDFDISALAISLPMLSAAIYILVWMIPKAIQTEQILFVKNRVPTSKYKLERKNNPRWFWFMIGFYFLGALLCFACVIALSFGLLKEPYHN